MELIGSGEKVSRVLACRGEGASARRMVVVELELAGWHARTRWRNHLVMLMVIVIKGGRWLLLASWWVFTGRVLAVPLLHYHLLLKIVFRVYATAFHST